MFVVPGKRQFAIFLLMVAVLIAGAVASEYFQNQLIFIGTGAVLLVSVIVIGITSKRR